MLAWADKVASWKFRQIVPAHFEAPVSAAGRDFREAFAFLEEQEAGEGNDLGTRGTGVPSGGGAAQGPQGRLQGLLSRLPIKMPQRRQGKSSVSVFPEEELQALRQVDADAVKLGSSEPPQVYKGRDF